MLRAECRQRGFCLGENVGRNGHDGSVIDASARDESFRKVIPKGRIASLEPGDCDWQFPGHAHSLLGKET